MRTLGAVVLGGVAVALYARLEAPWHALGFVLLVPWLVVLDDATTLRGAIVRGALLAVVFVLAAFSWFASAMAAYAGVPWVVALGILLALAPVLEPQLVTFAAARHVARRRGAGAGRTALIGAGVWVGTEWVWPKLFGDTLGYGLYGASWLRQAADIAGPAGLTLVLMLANEGTSESLRRRPLLPLGGVAVLLLAMSAYGAARVRAFAPPAGGPPLTAGIVQADITRYERLAAELGTYEAVRRILDTHMALSREMRAAGHLDLLLWPETVYPTTFGSPKSEAGREFDHEIAAFVGRLGIPLVFGAYDAEGEREYNAAVFLAPTTTEPLAFDTYRKATLFPFTERVPWLLEWPSVRRWAPWLGTWVPGGGPKVVTVPLPDGRTVRAAPLICYDVLAPEHVRAAVRLGAELLVTLSNDSWFAHGRGPWQHLVGAAFRSLESRRPQLRATNTGISAAIDATGALLGTIGLDRRAALVATVRPRATPTTLVVRWGDWLGPFALAVAVAALVTGRSRRSPNRPAC